MSDSTGTTEAFIDRLEARAYSRATEVPERVTKAILNIFPESTREKIVISSTATEGHLGVPMGIHVGVLDDNSSALSAVEEIFSSFSQSDLRNISDTLERRLDDECTFFLRIDKQEAYLGNTKLAMNADVISLQIRIMKWPRCTITDAEAIIRQLISLTGASE